MISQTAEYALRAAVFLAGRTDASTTLAVSDRTRVPSTYLAKIFRALGRAGVVRSRRGPNGGFVLARPPQEVSVLEVVDAVDPLKRLDHCPLGIAEHADAFCPLHATLAQAMSRIEETFRSTPLSALVESERHSSGLCHLPSAPVQGPSAAPDKEETP